MSACTGTTKAGNPCKAHPLKDQTTCLAHSDATIRESVGFIPDNGFAGRKPVPKPTEVARRLVDENIALVQRPYWRILGYDVEITHDGPRIVEAAGGGAKLHGISAKDGHVFVSEHDDLGAMMAAAEKLQDRSHGKARQAVELSGPEGDAIPVEVQIPDTDEYRLKVARLAAKVFGDDS